MIQKIKTKLLALSAVLLLAVPMAVPAMVSAAAPTDTVAAGVCSGAQDLQFGKSTGCANTTSENDFNTLVTNIINIFSVIVGIIAVLMIVVGGFRYITSGGDSTKVTAAKNTIMYALIGLVVVALSQLIVKFVLAKASTA